MENTENPTPETNTESKRLWRYLLAALLVLALAGGIFAGGFAAGYVVKGMLPHKAKALSTPPPSSSKATSSEGEEAGQAEAQPTPDPETLWDPFWEAWELLHEYYVRPLDDQTLVQGAIRGACTKPRATSTPLTWIPTNTSRPT